MAKDKNYRLFNNSRFYILAIALVIIGAAFSVAVFAAVLQRLLENAIAIKKENDLTV